MKKNFTLLIILFTLLSCAPKQWVLIDARATKIPVDSTADAIADSRMTAFIAPVKNELTAVMNQVIGESVEELRSERPESLLSNWSADVCLQAAAEYLNTGVDMAVVNMGGLRSALPKGNITVGDMYRLMPFENELVILWLKGSEVKKLLDIFALENGQGVAGVKMDIKDKKAVNCLIGGNPIDNDRLYTIATNDFLAGGNDRMIPLAGSEKRVDTGLKIRDIMIDCVKNETSKGNKIESRLDGRIRAL